MSEVTVKNVIKSDIPVPVPKYKALVCSYQMLQYRKAGNAAGFLSILINSTFFLFFKGL